MCCCADLERALMAGDVAVGDLEAAWNDRFAADFGFAVDRPSNVLQDVHGLWGCLGTLPPTALAMSMRAAERGDARDLPDLDDALGQGDLSPATGWLKANLQTIWPHAAWFTPAAVRNPAATLAYLGEILGIDWLHRVILFVFQSSANIWREQKNGAF